MPTGYQPSMTRAVSTREPPAVDHDHEAKRRLRKGTYSCWECKRRKMKCTYDPHSTDGACIGCRRRGCQCVSQEYPEDFSPNMLTSLGSSERPCVTQGQYITGPSGAAAPISLASAQNDSSTASAAQSSNVCNRSERLSRTLHQSLPSRLDLHRICHANQRPFVPVLAHQILTVPYADLHKDGFKTPHSLLEVPEPHAHPALLARYMLRLAIFLQNIESRETIEGLSEHPRDIKERLADLSISLVTTDDELLGSIEGLECIMLESMYHASRGNLRRSWLTGRRAVSIAQLMELDQDRARFQHLDTTTPCYPTLMWFRIVFLDRHLSLLLGLPQSSDDDSMASEAALAQDTDTGRLERMNCVFASRVLARNVTSRRGGADNLLLTQNLDKEIQRAGRTLPSKWWLVPNLDNIGSSDSTALFWDTRRLFAQVLHYNLLNQLHLPYMLRLSSATEHKYEYSRITCVNASREIILRFIALRGFTQIAYGWSCRIVDFLALMAAMTLLLAHLDAHRASNAQDLLAHQYLGDRALVVQVQEHMAEVNRANPDPLNARSDELLRRLLAIDEKCADEGEANSVTVQNASSALPTAVHNDSDDDAAGVHVPYFGLIKIAREGLDGGIGRQGLIHESNSAHHASTHVATPQVATPKSLGTCNGSIDGLPATSQTMPGFPISTYGVAHTATQQSGHVNTFEQNGQILGLAAGTEDWAFQGVDDVFFDNFMQGVTNPGNVTTDWTWQA